MPKPTRDDPEQSKRFIESAKKAEADESDEAFERAFKKVVRTKTSPTVEHSPRRKQSRR